VKRWALLEADERNKNAFPPDLWVFSLRQEAIEGGASVRFQSLVRMDLAMTEAIWHVHAGIDKWVDRPCLDRVENRSKQDRLGRRIQAESTPSSWRER
jgi:hypothetical protein